VALSIVAISGGRRTYWGADAAMTFLHKPNIKKIVFAWWGIYLVISFVLTFYVSIIVRAMKSFFTKA
jgi:hypothetical protein